jgi:hypothetical protein
VVAGDHGGGVRTTLLRSVRRDPGHAGALLLCSVLPSLATHAVRTHGDPGRSAVPADERAATVVRHSRKIARRDGAFTGTSLYFGMPAVMASIYCHRVLMILQIATIYGVDPFGPARAAEILVLQGKAPDVATAAATLRVLGTTAEERGEPRTPLRETVRGLPAAARAQWKVFRAQGPVGMVFAVLDVACYVVPLIGAPVSAASNARATRLLGNKARAFYGSGPTPQETAPAPGSTASAPPLVSPANAEQPHVRVTWGVKPTPPVGILLVLVVVTAVVMVATLFLGLHGSHHRHHTRWLLLSLAAAFVMFTYARLCWILRPERRRPDPFATPGDER